MNAGGSMSGLKKTALIFVFGILACGLVVMTGCKKTGTSAAVAGGTVQTTSAKLEDVKAAVAEAEKKLGELRAERAKLEQELKARKSGAK
jgi:hypothetical protein